MGKTDKNIFWNDYSSQGALIWGGYFPAGDIMAGGGEIGGNYQFKNEFGSFTSVKIMPVDENLIGSKDFFTVEINVRAKNGENIHIQTKYKTFPISQYDSYITDLKKRGAKKMSKGGAVAIARNEPAPQVLNADVNGRGGLVVGDSHADGGVPYVLEDSGTHIEEEGEEANIPNEIKDITKVYTFKGKNHEVIHKILQLVGLKLSNKVTSVRSGDLVICKASLWDDTVRTYTGTPIQIVSAVNESEGCNHIESGATMIENGKKVEMAKGGRIPKRYKNMGFSHVGQKKKSTRPEKKWMVLAKKGDKYKVVHGGYKGMKDFSQHHDPERRKKFWKRMGGEDSSKARDPFSPLYWHRRLGTWGSGGILEDGTVKVAWIDSDTPDIMESKMYDSLDEALKESNGKTFMVMELEESDGDYYKWKMLPYGMYNKFQKVLDWSGVFN